MTKTTVFSKTILFVAAVAASLTGPTFAMAGSYTGADSALVGKLLDRAGSYTCPSPTSPQAKAPQIESGSRQRDAYVKAAVMYAWAAECYAQGEETSKAEQNAQQMRSQLQNAEKLCSGTALTETGCATESLYRCNELR